MSTAAVDIIDAVRQGLSDYLRRELEPLFPGIKVFKDWPTPGEKLGEHSITVLATGEVEDWYYFPPTQICVSPNPTGNLGTVTYTYGRLDGIQLSIDCWSSAKAKRNKLSAAVRGLLNRTPSETLGGAAPIDGTRYGAGSGVVLKLDKFFNQGCEFQFGPMPRMPESSQAAQLNDWRATWLGNASLYLTDQSVMPLIKQLNLELNIKVNNDGLVETLVIPPGFPPYP